MSMTAPTHHIAAQPDDFARTVLMPGDPLRAQYIAEHYLKDVKQINEIRCMYAYTGTYKGAPVSVMAHGIGAPSMAVHAHELYQLYGVENIIRIGTAGGLSPRIRLRELLVAMGACYNTCLTDQFPIKGTFSAIASYPLMRQALDTADRLGISYQVGNVLSTDIFYPENSDSQECFGRLGCLAAEMEAAALYITAAACGKNALALLTVSDNIVTGEKTSAAERQSNFTAMMEVALESAVAIASASE
nr:purine-nucleoside phosphorylase [uncultured Oscillibacter sp.]